MKTLSELLREVDDARHAVFGYEVTNHYAYLQWSEADRITFDVGKEKARMRLTAAQEAYRAAVQHAAAFDLDDA